MYKYIALLALLIIGGLCSTSTCPQSRITVSENEFENLAVHDLHFTVNNILLISNAKLFKSDNDGVSWTKIEFNPSGPIQTVVVAEDETTVIVIGNTNKLWISFDGGNSFTPKNTPAGTNLLNVRINPNNHSWIMGSQVRGNCRQVGQQCSLDLYVTNNLGNTWYPVRTYIWMYDWLGDLKHPNRISIWEDTIKAGDQRDISESVVSVALDPLIYGFKTMIRNVTGYLVLESKVFAARPSVSEGLGLYISDDMGNTFRVAKTPSKLKGRRYTILDASPGSVFVNAQDANHNWGKTFVSNEQGSDFSLSLKHNPRADWGGCDFAKVRGIQGLYMINNYANIESNGNGRNIETFISYTEGSSWSRLASPQEGNCLTNRSACFLNLLGDTDQRSTWFSHEHAPGVLLGIGNVGSYLNNDFNAMNTYISRDAGLTWARLADGSYKYNMDQTGSILVLFKNSVVTNEFKYSLNYGKTTKTCSLPQTQAIQVDYVISIPYKEKFIVFGRRSGKEVTVAIDFSQEAFRTCTGYNYPEEYTSDYEYFSLGKCVNGQNLYFIRKRMDSECLPPPDVDTSRPYIDGNCPCTDNDYQCDYCFAFNSQGRCVVDNEECPGYNPAQRPPVCNNYWYESSGYRLVPGDKCVGGVTHVPIKHSC